MEIIEFKKPSYMLYMYMTFFKTSGFLKYGTKDVLIDFTEYFKEQLPSYYDFSKAPKFVNFPLEETYSEIIALSGISGDITLEIVKTSPAENEDFPYIITITNLDIQKLTEYIEPQFEKTYFKFNESAMKYVYISGNWNLYEKQERTLDTIFLKDNQEHKITDVIRNFIEDQADYIKYGQSYKLNILFKGDSGTGKSSIINALSNHYSKDVFYVNLHDFDSDTELLNALNCIKFSSFIVFEDIDSYFEELNTNNNKNISNCCLLNILDGCFNKQGNITILTVNSTDSLIYKYFRPFRIDHTFNFTQLDEYQIRNIIDKFLHESQITDKESVIKKISSIHSSPSELIKFLFDNRKTDNIDMLL